MASQPESREWLLDTGLTRLELLFRAIVYPPAEPILIADNDRTYRDASCGAGRLFGLPRNRIIGRRLDNFAESRGSREILGNARAAFRATTGPSYQGLDSLHGRIKLDVERFREELRNQTYSDRVCADFLAGVQNGVYHTPGLYLDGVRYDSEWDRESLLSRLRI